MDHNQSIRKFERLMETEANHARDAAIELAVWFSSCQVSSPASLHRRRYRRVANAPKSSANWRRKSKRPTVSSAGSVGWEASRAEPHSAASCALAERPRLRRHSR